MNKHELINIWKTEEHVAHIHGWDFSHIEGRYTEETDLPWDYRHIILNYLKPEMKLLDIDTAVSFCYPSTILTEKQVQPKLICPMSSYVGKLCFLWELIFRQATERIRCHSVILNLTL